MKRLSFVLTVSLGLIAATQSQAVPLFSDNFDGEAAGLALTNTLNFTVTNTGSGGSIDVLQQGQFSLNCAGGAGRCVDLDGTSPLGGIFQSNGIALSAGNYELSYLLGGSQRGERPSHLAVDHYVEQFRAGGGEGAPEGRR